jgi:acyl-CoA synthetase (AMP-forming)/AMP-acid ligase II
VREVAVVGRPDPRLGERCAAWVVPRGETPPTLAELTSYLESCGVSKTYYPEFLRVIDELPKTPSGKVQKFVLRSMEAQRPD